MMRKGLALLIVVIATGLAPATAVLGFCAKMPCCFEETESGPALDAGKAGCCSTISCYEGPSPELTFAAKAKAFRPTTIAYQSVILSLLPVAAQLAFDDRSPPPTTSERLSSLSIFLI